MERKVTGERQEEATNVFCFFQCGSFSMLAVGNKDMSSHLFIYNTVHSSLCLPQNPPQLIWYTHASSTPHFPLSLKDITMVLQSSISLCLHCSWGFLFTNDLSWFLLMDSNPTTSYKAYFIWISVSLHII